MSEYDNCMRQINAIKDREREAAERIKADRAELAAQRCNNKLLRAERDQLREALGMMEVQQQEVAKALRLEPSDDSVYLHYQIMAVLDALQDRISSGSAAQRNEGA